MKILGGLNQVVKSALNLISDLKEFEMRLEHYDDSKSEDKEKKEAGMLALQQIWLDNVDLKKVTPEMRRNAKMVNFGIIYGISGFGLARQLGISRGDAQRYIDAYFERYPGVLKYMDNIRKQAHDDGFVETLFGRRLYLPEINARNKQLQQAAERTAINAPMQGTAADIIKRAMVDVENWLLKEHADEARMTMQVHDELILEVKESALDKIRSGLEKRMSAAAELDVPLLVEAGVGDNWDEAH